MLGSRVCWQLLLLWALLLGQPVFGDLDASEEPPLAETEGPVPVSQEAEEPEEAVSGESADPELTLEDIRRQALNLEELEMLYGPPDEEIEERARQSRLWLDNSRDGPFGHSAQFLKGMAVHYHNQKSDYLSVPYENGNVKIKKAIGTTIYVTFLLVRTNCTKEEGEALRLQAMFDDEEMANNLERKRCEVPPDPEQEIEECTFTLFRDARSKYKHEVVTDHHCVPFILRS